MASFTRHSHPHAFHLHWNHQIFISLMETSRWDHNCALEEGEMYGMGCNFHNAYLPFYRALATSGARTVATRAKERNITKYFNLAPDHFSLQWQSGVVKPKTLTLPQGSKPWDSTACCGEEKALSLSFTVVCGYTARKFCFCFLSRRAQLPTVPEHLGH